MKTLRILALPSKKHYSDLHPFYKWKKQFRDHDIKIEFCFDHSKVHRGSPDRVILQHKYFHHRFKGGAERGNEVPIFLGSLKKEAGKLIWWDAQDTSCSTGFPIISYVDVFVKNQILKHRQYFTGSEGKNNLRVWLDPDIEQKQFTPCPADQLHKIKVGWNIGYNDYRNFFYKFRKLLSNYTGYNLYPLRFTDVNVSRPLDLTFRGMMKYDQQYPQHNAISFQRNAVLGMLNTLNLNIAHGRVVPRKQYLRELSTSKVSVSPFGYGEVCYRDFESFITGSLLIKPSMDHLTTFPDIFIPNETYIPVSWNLDDLQEKAEDAVRNYNHYKQIAINGQEHYKKVINDSERFIGRIKEVIE